MKNLTKILTLFAFICIILPMKAQKYYDDQWKKVAKNYENGQYKSDVYKRQLMVCSPRLDYSVRRKARPIRQRYPGAVATFRFWRYRCQRGVADRKDP